MKIRSSFNEVTNKAKSAMQRFPITLVWAIVGTFFTLWFVDQKMDRTLEFNYIKIILTFILGISWLIATRLLINYFKEERNQNKSWLIAIPLVFLFLYYFNLPNDKDAFNDIIIPYRFALFLVTGHLLIFFSPFIFTWDKKAYWNYLKSIFTAFATSAIFSLVLYLGLTIAIMALKYLFKFEIKPIRYFELFIFCLGIINTWIFLADIPKNNNKQVVINYPKALLVFVKYILIPLTMLYLVILYSYSFKILINWDLPKGWVSYLVIALSVLGFIIHILINPIRKTSESRVMKKFYPWFYYALLPMLLLLFIAIFKRIFDYGFTENRYLVLILSIWIFGMTLYILFSKRKKLRYLPMSVAILTLVVSFGFWGMFSVSKNSQANEFNELFVKMKANNFEVKQEEKTRFTSIVRYLTDRNALGKTNAILGFNPTEIFKDNNKWNIANKLSDTLKLKVTDFDITKNNRNRHYYYSEQKEVINVKGYDYLRNFQFYRVGIVGKSFNKKFLNKINQYNFRLDSNLHTSILIIKENDTLHKIDLKPLINNLKNKQSNNALSQKELTIVKEYDELKVKIIFKNISIQIKKEDKIIPLEITNANAIILLKEKNN